MSLYGVFEESRRRRLSWLLSVITLVSYHLSQREQQQPGRRSAAYQRRSSLSIIKHPYFIEPSRASANCGLLSIWMSTGRG